MLDAVQEGLRLLLAVGRKPAILQRWLAGARAAQIAASLFLAFVLFGLPIALEELARIYPPVESRNAFARLFDRATNRPDPRLEARRRQLTVLTWAGGLTGVAVLLLAALPRTVERAAEEARALEERGDSVASARGRESILLYRGAVDLTVDSAVEAELRAKLRTLRSAAIGRTPTPPTPDAELRALRGAETLIAPARAPSGQREHVGIEQRYRLVKELGRGGMGVVYQALDSVLEREVALKELPSHLTAQSELARRFKQEARMLARLSHPNIVQVHDLVEDGDRLWIAMELVKGGTLADAIERCGGAIPWPRAIALADQIAAGLDYAHAQGVIHRDIKPINVLLTQEEGGSAKITDFGLAKHIASAVHTQEGTLLGSARYMSPEQAAGRATDARSDIYSFGVTLYEMLAGRTPFEGEVAAVLAQHLSQPPPPLRRWQASVPERLASLVHGLLAKDPEERPATLRDTRETLVAIARDDAAARTEARRA